MHIAACVLHEKPSQYCSEKERERERKRERERERERERKKEKERKRNIEREKERKRERESERESSANRYLMCGKRIKKNRINYATHQYVAKRCVRKQ